MQPPDLHTCLTRIPWRQLLAIMARHGLACSTRWPKAQLVATLHDHLTQPTTLPLILSPLAPDSQQALHALVQAGGALPATPFFQRFGAVRPYRPWRAGEETLEPWRTPASPTEQLWYLGLLYLDPPRPHPGVLQHVVLPAELWPELSRLLASVAAGADAQRAPVLLPRPGQPPDVLWHLALWLASSQEQTVQPRPGGWLPPTVLTKLAMRLGLDHPAPRTALRSERQAPYLAFLHHLAKAAGLAVDQPTWALTVQGWQWLAAPTAARWQQLWRAWLAARVTVGQTTAFAWAQLTPQALALILAQLRQWPVNVFTPLAALVEQIHLHDTWGQIAQVWGSAEETVHALCTGPLFWLGVIDLAAVTEPTPAPRPVLAVDDDPAEPIPPPAPPHLVRLTALGAWLLELPAWGPPPFAPPPFCHTVANQPEALLVAPTVAPVHLARLAPLCTWTPPEAAGGAQRLQLSAERIGQAVAGGEQVEQIFQRVTEALGQPPSRRLGQRLRAWAQAGEQVRIQPLVVLETTDAQLMGRLRSRKLVRRHLTTVLSPTRSALDPNHLSALVQTLRTLGLYTQPPPEVVNAGLRSSSPKPAARAPKESVVAPYADTLWLLVQLYQGLGAVVELPVRLPDGLVDTLRAQLTASQQAAAASASQGVLAQIAATLQGYLRLSTWQLLAQPPGLVATLETALAAGQDVQITYWGAGRDQKTVRRVTPYWLETRAGALYLIAYCHLRAAERVFRVDRIEACQVIGEQRPETRDQ